MWAPRLKSEFLVCCSWSDVCVAKCTGARYCLPQYGGFRPTSPENQSAILLKDIVDKCVQALCAVGARESAIGDALQQSDGASTAGRGLVCGAGPACVYLAPCPFPITCGTSTDPSLVVCASCGAAFAFPLFGEGTDGLPSHPVPSLSEHHDSQASPTFTYLTATDDTIGANYAVVHRDARLRCGHAGLQPGCLRR